ncbi:hypothetical protein DSO57_1025318 [Entomophthora muscae]|uniref:Uncharacterized protein n=1 Tax=Entomophthora muscae TaxID=34485 RepID=A0ACC2RTL0_9FUNG|nr:hypothetical protein DSO57_1025318 [Entomophthora muscae]
MLSNIPNHFPFKTLHQELINGLHNYGTDPTITFGVPKGIKNLAGPTATANVLPHKDLNPKSIPAWAALPSAPDTPFQARFEGAHKGYTKCRDLSHSISNCPTLSNSLPSGSPVAPHTLLWESTISTENIAQEEPMEIGTHEQNKLHNVSQANQSARIQSGLQSGEIRAQITSQASNAPTMHEHK